MNAQSGEGRNQDYKLTFDPKNPRAKTDLVKDIVAMANSGGGRIVFGRDETNRPGIDPKIADALDSARIQDYLEMFVDKGLINLSHSQQQLPGGNVLLTLSVEAVTYPVVMKKDGTWKGFSTEKDRPLFRKGDVLVRHGSRNERISQADMRAFIDAAYQRGLDHVLSSIQVARQAGPEAQLDFYIGAGALVRGPLDLLNNTLSRRRLGLPHILSGQELLWLFLSRSQFKPTLEQLELIIESALRRPPTLYWWLLDDRVDVDVIKSILYALPDAEDRDKSDAGSSAVELAGLYLRSQDAARLVEMLRQSRYVHFRRAAAEYRGKENVKRSFIERVQRARYGGRHLKDMSRRELEELADSVARNLFRRGTTAGSRTLADVTRTLWARRKGLLPVAS